MSRENAPLGKGSGATRSRRAALAFLAAALLSACATPLAGKRLTSFGPGQGRAREPHVAWNGSHFGILFVRDDMVEGQLTALKVTRDGSVAGVSSGLPRIGYGGRLGYRPFGVSNLVWNPDHRQFAFAYADGSKLRLARMDAELAGILPGGEAIEIPLPTPHDPISPSHLSLVWNPVRREYGLSWIPTTTYGCNNCHPEPASREGVYLSRIAADGGFVGPSYQLVAASHGGLDRAERTSLAFDASSGRYALAYFMWEQGALLGTLDDGLAVTERVLTVGWDRGDVDVRLLHDDKAGDWLAAVARTTSLRIWSAAPGGEVRGSANRTFQHLKPVFGVARYGGAHAYLLCASDGQARCWLATDRTQESADLFYPVDEAVPRLEPSLVVIDEEHPYVVWTEDGQVAFGPYSR